MVNAANLDQVAEAGLTQVCLPFLFVCLFVLLKAACSLRFMSSFSFYFYRYFLSDNYDQKVSPRCFCQRRCYMCSIFLFLTL